MRSADTHRNEAHHSRLCDKPVAQAAFIIKEHGERNRIQYSEQMRNSESDVHWHGFRLMETDPG
ncbi:hypothetical protein A6X21_16115 [Planctopirus hydrillae]|uniref:Uncharacterized protein n=1 Tax=Planctopirus hydrillae TaxID=1841610 RepID=A0A1C3ETA5_9PLAN|nr:hypothetical protein A6X21_16115 [Planctopirus hydrillae]